MGYNKHMNLLLLGGMSPRNREWIREVRDTLAPLFETSLVHDYAHWAAAGPHIDLEHELHAAHNQVRELGDYMIFAKSAGVVLSLKGIAEQALRPKACLFVGTPLRFVHEHGHQMDVWLKSLTMPAVFAQNAHDPAGSYHELEGYLREHLPSPHHRLVELPGETHDYTDLATLRELAETLL